ncbi:MAG: hypothetical protein Q8R28_19370 [Dehalococcoidia bacterium]|nr:hypothetical protein [Dehalococcoidia bacterium]
MDKIGEVVEATTGEFTAQSYQLHWAPSLGSLVKTGAPVVGTVHESPLQTGPNAIYGVVCHICTASLEPGRRAMARGRDLEEEEEVYKQNPQLDHLMRTSFSVLIVGHTDGSRICHYLPPRPPRIHAFVYPCPQDEVAGFTQALDFLNLLLSASLPIPAEELVAACLRTAATAREDSRAFLVRAGKELAFLLAAEPARLNAILRKIRP